MFTLKEKDMITTKKELKEYILSDREAMGWNTSSKQNFKNQEDKKSGGGNRSILKEWIKGNTDDVLLMKYIVQLRKHEYAFNNRHGVFGQIRYLISKHRFRRLCRKRNLFISPNVFGKGLHIVHFGYFWADGSCKIGKNCTVLPRVLLGKKKPGIKPPCIFIGDNCYIGTGSTILGPIRIGNNVTIAAGAVVVKDVPDNAIVAGNPAKVIKIKI